MGIKDFAVLSDGKVFENQKYLKHNLRKLRVLQRTKSSEDTGTFTSAKPPFTLYEGIFTIMSFGRKMPTTIRMMATEDTVAICVFVLTLPLIAALAARPTIISSQYTATTAPATATPAPGRSVR